MPVCGICTKYDLLCVEHGVDTNEVFLKIVSNKISILVITSFRYVNRFQHENLFQNRCLAHHL